MTEFWSYCGMMPVLYRATLNASLLDHLYPSFMDMISNNMILFDMI